MKKEETERKTYGWIDGESGGRLVKFFWIFRDPVPLCASQTIIIAFICILHPAYIACVMQPSVTISVY